MTRIRIGIVGLGANSRLRHMPGFAGCEEVEILAVVNRSAESTAAAARQYGIPRTYERWQQLIEDNDVDAVMIGTWPYLHCPITVAALRAGKHVLCEARMARNAVEARQMYEASRQAPAQIAQIVPSPFGLVSHRVICDMIDSGYIGVLRELVVQGTNNVWADPRTPLHWRQSAEFSGLNMLSLGILHETLVRWVPDPVRVLAQIQTFTVRRADPETGELCSVGTPDSVQVLTELPGGARGTYHLSSAIHHGPGPQIHLYGTEGTLRVEFAPVERLYAARREDQELTEVPLPLLENGGWRVEEEFVAAIRGEGEIQFTDFASGLRYMQFTAAVARSARNGQAVSLSPE